MAYASLWSETFDDAFFLDGLKQWLARGEITHDLRHLRPFDAAAVPAQDAALVAEIAQDLRQNKTILGVFDEAAWGCITRSSLMNC